MPDKKLTDNEIIKALECCVSEQYTCEQCPYQEKKHYDYDNGFEIMPNGKQYDDWSCDRWLLTDLLDLINRLQAENEKLNSDSLVLIDSNINLQELYQLEREKVKKAKQKIIDIGIALKTAKAEAYKEFAEKLKKEKHICLPPIGYPIDENDWVIYEDDIDNLLKELVGE